MCKHTGTYCMLYSEKALVDHNITIDHKWCTVEPLLWGHPFCTRKVAYQKGRPLKRDINQYFYVWIYIFKWPLQRGWPLVRVASQKGLHCIWLVGWLCLTSHRQRGHLETAPPFTVPCEEVKLDKYTVPTGNWTLGRHMAIHYVTAALRKPHYSVYDILYESTLRIPSAPVEANILRDGQHARAVICKSNT